MALSGLQRTFKIAGQLGLTQLALYAQYRIGLKTGRYRLLTETHLLQTEINGEPLTLLDLFSLPDRDQLAKTLGEEGQRALLAEADEIVDGKFRMFGGEPVEIKLAFEQPLHHWTKYETNPKLLSNLYHPTLPQAQGGVSDIKYIWEPARFGWAYTLGRGYYLTQNKIYAETFWSYFETFSKNNPPNMGPHWMNGQEVGIRLMALVWANQVFGNPPNDGREAAAGSSAERRARLGGAIAAHAVRIPPTLLYARAQNNNHLVTEAAALYTAGLALPQHPRASRWRKLGWHWLNWAIRHQISSYGEYIQLSSNYHRVMLQAALWVDAIRDVDWPRLTLQALGRATHWLFGMLDPTSGRIPNLGSNDGALILPLSTAPFTDFRPTVQAAARAFLRFQMPADVWDELSLWLGLRNHKEAYEPNLYLSDHLRGQSSWVYLRAGQFRSRLGHMDQLHLDLWWRGLNVAQDAGTYLYNADPPWDNPLVRSQVHNTMMVDGRDQMTRGGRFITLDWFPAYVKNIVSTDDSVLGRLQGYHEGFPGVRHERTVTVYTDERWLVEDKLISKDTHSYRLHWLLPDWDWDVKHSDQRVKICLNSPHGKVSLIFQTKPQISHLDSLLSIVRAGEIVYGARDFHTYEGWFSPTYGIKEPALSLVIEVTSEHGIFFVSQFKFP